MSESSHERSPLHNSDYSYELNELAVEEIAEIVQETLLECRNSHLADFGEYEAIVGTIELDDIFAATRGSIESGIRHTITLEHLLTTCDAAGETYKISNDTKLVGLGQPSSRSVQLKTVKVFVPDDHTGSTVMQIDTLPQYDLNILAHEIPVDADEITREIFWKFARHIDSDYLQWSKMTMREVKDLTELLKKVKDQASADNWQG